MHGQCLVPSLTKKRHFLLVGSGTTAIYTTLNTNFSLKFFNIFENRQKFFSFGTVSKEMTKIRIRQKKLGQILI